MGWLCYKRACECDCTLCNQSPRYSLRSRSEWLLRPYILIILSFRYSHQMMCSLAGDLDEAIIRRLPRAFEIGLPVSTQREQVASAYMRVLKVCAHILSVVQLFHVLYVCIDLSFYVCRFFESFWNTRNWNLDLHSIASHRPLMDTVAATLKSCVGKRRIVLYVTYLQRSEHRLVVRSMKRSY